MGDNGQLFHAEESTLKEVEGNSQPCTCGLCVVTSFQSTLWKRRAKDTFTVGKPDRSCCIQVF